MDTTSGDMVPFQECENYCKYNLGIYVWKISKDVAEGLSINVSIICYLPSVKLSFAIFFSPS